MGSGLIGSLCTLLVTDDQEHAKALSKAKPCAYCIIVLVHPEFVSAGECVYCMNPEISIELMRDDTLGLVCDHNAHLVVFSSEMGEARLLQYLNDRFGIRETSLQILHEDARHKEIQESAHVPSLLV